MGPVCSPLRRFCLGPACPDLPSSTSDTPEGLRRSRPCESVSTQARMGHPGEPVRGAGVEGPLASEKTWQAGWSRPLSCTSSLLAPGCGSEGSVAWDRVCVWKEVKSCEHSYLAFTEHLLRVRCCAEHLHASAHEIPTRQGVVFGS